MTAPYPFPTPADEFADKRVLVTGGTRGIGAAVVRRFQLAGARVAATARSAPADPVDGAVFIAADIRAGTVRRILRDREPARIPISAVRPASRRQPSKVAVFVDFLAELLAETDD